MTDQPLKINFSQEKIVEAINLLTTIAINKDKIKQVDTEYLQQIAYDIIYETCSAIMHTLKDADKKREVLNDFIKQSNLKYLTRTKINNLH